MQIVWDERKAAGNIKKHRVSFEEAATCLLDQMALVTEDPDAEGEQRFILIGMSSDVRLLTICYSLPTIPSVSYQPANRPNERKPAMRKEYDFSKAKRAKDVPHLARLQAENGESGAGKTRITTYLDNDVVEWLKARGEEEHKGYQTVLNELLRRQLAPAPPIEEVLRRVIREELKAA